MPKNAIDRGKDLVKFELSTHHNSFIYELYENYKFNVIKYNDLIKNLKGIKSIGLGLDNFDKEFFYLIIDRTHLIHFIYSDVRMGYFSINLDEQVFFQYLEELLYEIKAIFDDTVTVDFNGESY